MKDHANRTNIFGRARMLFMALLMVLTMTATAMSGTDAYAANDTVYVATYDQLQEALEETQGVKEIVIDPQAAVEKGEVVYGVEEDENSDAFYIGFDGPLTVSHDITITSADDVDVYFARSDSFRRDQGKPALLNIDSTGNLNLDGLITMTGEEVATTFYEADEENPAEFVFSVKSKDGTGEDNEVWNRGQALQGGFYIQNNGGEYTLGDDVIMEDINLADDVEGVEQIHEVEKTTLRSLFSSNKDDEEIVEEEATQEEAVEEKTVEEETTQEEEVVVAPTPKKSLKMGLKSSPLKSGGTVQYIATLEQLKDAAENGGTYTVIGDITIDKQIQVKKNLVLNGSTGSVIRRGLGSANYEGNFPMFKVEDGATFKLGGDLKLSGIPGKAEKVPNTGRYDSTEMNIYRDDLILTLDTKGAVDSFLLPTKAVFDDGANSYGMEEVNRTDAWNRVQQGMTGQWRTVWLSDVDEGSAGGYNPPEGHAHYPYKSYMVFKNKYFPNYVLYQDGNNLKVGKLVFTSGVGWHIAGDTSLSKKFYFSTTDIKNGNPGVTYMHSGRTWEEFVRKFGGTVTKETVSNFQGWTNTDVLSGTAEAPKAFFVQVENGTLEIADNVTITEYTTVSDIEKTPKYHAPIVVNAANHTAKLVMTGGSIEGNTVGYIGDSLSSTDLVKDIADDIKGADGTGKANMTNTAGGVIFTNNAEGEISGGYIKQNKADAGGILVTEGATVKFTGGHIDSNIGVHHAGAAHVEHGANLIMSGDAGMKNNVAWYKGGAVWATEWGTSGYAVADWSKWPNDFPTLYTDRSQPSNKGGGNFVMNGGTIENNTAFARAGAVEVESNGVQLNSGEIKNNYCRSLGGAIYIEGDSPSYSYTLVLPKGYITDNKSVFHGNSDDINKTLNRKIKDTVDENGNWLTNSSTDSWDRDFGGAMGNGGGIWLCPVGGTSVFTGNNIYIWDNNAERNNGGEDFYLHKGNGSAMLQQMQGTWVNEVTGQTMYDSNSQTATTSVVNGPLSLTNDASFTKPGTSTQATGVIITGNWARDGGAIACNGTFIIGEGKDVHRYNSKLTISKVWDVDPASDDVVVLKLQYEYPKGSDKWHDLKYMPANEDGTTAEEKTFEVELDGNADPLSVEDAIGEIAPSADNKTWNASAFIPMYVDHKTGSNPDTYERVYLYTIKNPEQTNYKISSNPDVYETGFDTLEELDLNNEDHVGHLYRYIKKQQDENQTPDIQVANWNLQVEETIKNKGKIYKVETQYPTGGVASAYAEEIVLEDPITGEKVNGGQFSISYSTVTFGQTVTNKLKTVEVDLTKVDNSSAEGNPVGGVEFILAKAERGGSSDYRFAGTENDWRGTTEHNKTYEDTSVALQGATGQKQLVSGADGSLKIEDLEPARPGQPDNVYFLFEKQTPSRFQENKSPWLIQVASDGTVKVRAIKTDYKNKVNYNPGPDGGNNQPIVDYNDKKVWHRYWKDAWFEESETTKLVNEWKKYELEKVGINDRPLDGATFKMYKVRKGGVSGAASHDYTVDTSKEVAVTVTGNKINMAIKETGEYFLFEEKAPNDYVRAKDPWKVIVSNDGVMSVYTMNGSLEENGSGSPAGKYWVGSNTEVSDVEAPETYTANYFNNPLKKWPEWFFSSTPITGTKISNEHNPIKITKVMGVVTNNSVTLSKDKTISGAKFQLYQATHVPAHVSGTDNNHWVKGNPIGGELVSDENGIIQLPREVSQNIETGPDYWLEETYAAPGYEKSTRPWILNGGNGKIDNVFWPLNDVIAEGDVTKVVAGNGNIQRLKQNGTLYVFNEPLKFRKVSAQNNDQALSNVKFSIYKIANWNDNNGQDGAHLNTDDWTSWERDFEKSSTLIGTATSKANGEFDFGNLINEAGGYMIFEDTEANGYVKAQNPWILAIRTDGTYQLRHTTDASAKKDNDYWAAATYEKCDGLVLENERKPIELYKVDEKKDAKGRIDPDASKLAGASFVIVKASRDDDNDWYLTDAAAGKSVKALGLSFNGNKILGPTGTDGKLTIEGLDAGDYLLFEETAPKGFRWSKSPWLIHVEESPTTGYTWQVFRVKDEFRDQVKKDSNKAQGPVNAINLGDLQSTQRYWHNDWFDRTISVDKLDNEPKYLEKVDSTDKTKLLPDVEFKLYGTKENSYYTNKYLMEDSNAWGSGSNTEWDLKSGSDGRVELPSIVTRTAGKYILVETKAAPGYKSANSVNPWVIEVASDGTFTVKAIKENATKYTGYGWYTGDISTDTSNGIKVLNKPGQFYLTKIDGYTDKPLSGAVFHIYGLIKGGTDRNPKWTVDWNNDLGTTTPTGSNGRIQLPDTVGTSISYIMFEEKAPTGYIKSATPWILQKNTLYGTYVEVWKATPISGEEDTYTYTSGDACHENELKNYPSVDLTKVDLKTVTVDRTSGKEVVTPKSDLLKLSGVKFKLYNATVNNGNWTPNGNPIKVEGSDSEGIITTDKDGVLQLGTLEGSVNGKNYLLEEYEPKNSAYVKPAAKWRITVYKNGSTYSYKVYVPTDDTGTTYIENSATDGIHYITNSQVYDLPSAGGMGTYWFMVIGAMMMGFALTAGFTKMNLLKLLRR